MKRRMILAKVALTISLASVPAAQQPPPLEARFIGNMAVAISDGTLTVVSDFPYQSGYSVYMTYPADELQKLKGNVVALITHRHGDHWEPNLFAKTGWKVIGPPDTTKGLDPSHVVPLANPITLGPLAVEPIKTPHANIDHHSYVVTWHGRRLYFSGDTESINHLVALKDLDVAFVSPWLYRSVLGSGRPLNAKRIVIYHHTASERVPECQDPCMVPRQGERIPL